jgi:monoamine oxidase
MTFDVVVIGAGVAGLAAARAIAEVGLRVVVLEAQERVGGRIRTVRDGDTVIELGAEFVHGRPPELWALLEEAGLETYERTGDFLRRGEDGLQAMEEGNEEDDPLEKLEEFAGPDCSFAEYLRRIGVSEQDARRELSYVEGFNAADAQEASAMALGKQQKAEDEVDGDRSWRVRDGYVRVPEFLRDRLLAGGGELELGAEVVAVAWEDERGGREEKRERFATVTCRDGRTWRAKRVVIAVPLGVLRTGTVRFEPDVPRVMEAAGRLRMGHVCRFTMIFARRLWPEKMSFLLTQDLLPTVWWTSRPEDSHSLTGWVGGPRSLGLLGLSLQDLERRAVEAVAQALEVDEDEVRRELRGFHTHDWDADPWSRGAYTWVPVGGLEASAGMCEPVEDTLYFAGEHTDTTGHWGTVHAALRSGLRAARQVVDAARS